MDGKFVKVWGSSESLPIGKYRRCYSMKLEKLTETERKFAEENHNLIYEFLHQKELSIEEYYNIAVFGFLKSVQVYHRRKDLNGKYKFSVIAWKYMQSEIGNYIRMACSKKRTTTENILSLDADNEEKENIYNMIGGKSVEADVMENFCMDCIMENLTEIQRKIICLKMEGYSNTETFLILEIPSSTFYKEINRIKKVLENLIA